MLLTQIVLPETIAGSAVPAAAVIVVRCVIVIWLCADAAPASASATAPTSTAAGAAIVQWYLTKNIFLLLRLLVCGTGCGLAFAITGRWQRQRDGRTFQFGARQTVELLCETAREDERGERVEVRKQHHRVHHLRQGPPALGQALQRIKFKLQLLSPLLLCLLVLEIFIDNVVSVLSTTVDPPWCAPCVAATAGALIFYLYRIWHVVWRAYSRPRSAKCCPRRG